MIQSNINYLTNYFYKGRSTPKKTLMDNIKSFTEAIQHVQRKFNAIMIRKAFVRIFARRKPRVYNLLFIDRMIRQRLEKAFLELKRKVVVNGKILNKAGDRYNHPLTLLNRVLARKIKEHKAFALGRLDSNRFYIQKIAGQLSSVVAVHNQYIKRNIKAEGLRALIGFSRKKTQYSIHISSLEYLLDCIRVRIVFFAFAQMSVKTVVKNINELEREKSKLREQARIQHTKKSEVESDLKRKIHNMLGKINEQRINNNSVMINKTRQNGMKLTKINQKLRIAEIKIADQQYVFEKMKEQLQRKQLSLENRGSSHLLLEEIQKIYNTILQSQDLNNKSGSIVNKLIPKQKVAIFRESLLFHVLENVKLKQLMVMYEQTGTAKSDVYSNVNNENISLKQLISSIIYHQLNASQVQDMIGTAQTIDEEAKLMRSQLLKLRAPSK